MHHKVTKSTKTYGGSGWEAGSYRTPAAKARADAVSGEILGAAIEVQWMDSNRPLTSIPQAQLLTYLRISGRWLGFLLNFKTDRLRNGLQRMVNG